MLYFICILPPRYPPPIPQEHPPPGGGTLRPFWKIDPRIRVGRTNTGGSLPPPGRSSGNPPPGGGVKGENAWYFPKNI